MRQGSLLAGRSHLSTLRRPPSTDGQRAILLIVDASAIIATVAAAISVGALAATSGRRRLRSNRPRLRKTKLAVLELRSLSREFSPSYKSASAGMVLGPTFGSTFASTLVTPSSCAFILKTTVPPWHETST